MKKSIIIEENKCYNLIENELNKLNVKKILLVCKSPERYATYTNPLKDNFDVVLFNGFSQNPSLEETEKGVLEALKFKPDALFAIGGGSSIDTAKGIKYGLKGSELQPIIVAFPTTAGSGSEATRFAVVYRGTEKLSYDDEALLPNIAVLDSDILLTLPLYQKKATLLDALCHSVEAYWSVNSTDKSKEYALEAIKIITVHYKEYLKNNEKDFPFIMRASHLAGKAINISKTTAAHAMSYKITKLKNLPHGIAAFMCLPYICEHIAESTMDKTQYINLLSAFNVKSFEELAAYFKSLLKEFELDGKESISKTELNEMVSGVNLQRLENTPIELSKNDIENIYKAIFTVEE